MPLFDPYGRPATAPTSPEEIERLFNESKRRVEENTRSMLDGIQRVTESYEKSVVKMGEAMDKQLEKAQQNFLKVSTTIGQGVADAITRSIKIGIPSTIGQITPLFGKMGEDLGAKAGMGLAGMLGKSGPWGAVAAIVGKAVVGEIGMQVEGFRMVGARVAPVATAGRRLDVDFDKVGAQYVRAIRDVGRASGATSDEVAGLADKLSKIGVAFLAGGEKEVQFSLATERVMNLNRGTVASLQTEIVTQYGESIKETRKAINDIRDAQKEFISINWQTNSSISRTLSSGQTLVDLLGQITSSGRNSGATLRDMNNLAAALVKTMATTPGGPMFRPGQMAEIGGGLIQGVLPGMASDINEEFRRSKLDEMLMNQTSSGQRLHKQIQESAPPSLRDPKMFVMQQQKFMASGGRGAGMKIALSKLIGMQKLFGDLSKGQSGQMGAYAMLEKMGIAHPQAVASMEMMDNLTKRAMERGLNPRDTTSMEKVLKDYMKESQKDPRMQAQLRKAGLDKDILDAAEEQGRAMLSTMDNISNTLMDIRTWSHNYWNNWKSSTAEVFGLSKNAPWYQVLAGYDPSGTVDKLFGFQDAVNRGGQQAPMTPAPAAPPVTRSDTMLLTRSTARASDFEMRTRDVNVMP